MPNRKVGYVSPRGEFNSPEFGVFVETAGYRTAKQQIESFLFAGEVLQASRQGKYDSDEYEPNDDPSLDVRDYELSEIGMVMNSMPEAQKGVDKGETGASVSPSTESIDDSDGKDAS